MVSTRRLIVIVSLLASLSSVEAQSRLSTSFRTSAAWSTQSFFSPESVVAVSPRETKSTTLAMVLSAVVPGAGQVYTARYWKIPVIWGFGFYFASTWNKANNLYNDASDRYDLSLKQGAKAGQGDAQAKYERDFYHDERDRFAFYIALTYALNIIDAYVGASLYNFDVSDDLGGNAKLQLKIPFR